MSSSANSGPSRPGPSHASIPSAKSKRAMRRARGEHHHHVSGHASGGNSSDAPPASAALRQVKRQARRARHQPSHQPQHSPQQQHSPIANDAQSEGLLAKLFNSWMTSPPNTDQSPAHGDSLVAAPLPQRSAYVFSEDQTSSFDSIDEDGSQQDEQRLEFIARPPSAVHSHHGEEALAPTRVPSRSPRPHLVPCEYAAFGCESFVQPSNGNGGVDEHYHAAYEHHLSLLSARHAIVSSQKTQQAKLLQQEYTARLHLERKLTSRERKYAKLREAFERKRIALKEMQRIARLPDLVGSYLLGDEGLNQAQQIVSLQEQLAAAKADIALKDRLLVEAAEFLQQKQILAEEAEQQQAQAQTQQQASPPATTLAPPQLPSAPFVPFKSPAAMLTRPSMPSRPTSIYQPHTHHHAQAHHQPLAPAPVHQLAQGGSPLWVPHSALRGIAPYLTANTLGAILFHAPQPTAQAQPMTSSISTGTRYVEEIQPGEGLTRGAQLGLTNFCPTVWLKKTRSALRPEGK